MASTRPPKTYSPSARTGRRSEGSGGDVWLDGVSALIRDVGQVGGLLRLGRGRTVVLGSHISRIDTRAVNLHGHPDAAGGPGQLPRVRGRTPGLPPGGRPPAPLCRARTARRSRRRGRVCESPPPRRQVVLEGGRLRGDGRADDEVPGGRGGRDAVSPPPRPTASIVRRVLTVLPARDSSFEVPQAAIEVADRRGEPAVDISYGLGEVGYGQGKGSDATVRVTPQEHDHGDLAVGPPARAHRPVDEPRCVPRSSIMPSVLRGCGRAPPRAPRTGRGVRPPLQVGGARRSPPPPPASTAGTLGRGGQR